jgi:hypothetical protein
MWIASELVIYNVLNKQLAIFKFGKAHRMSESAVGRWREVHGKKDFFERHSFVLHAR